MSVENKILGRKGPKDRVPGLDRVSEWCEKWYE